ASSVWDRRNRFWPLMNLGSTGNPVKKESIRRPSREVISTAPTRLFCLGYRPRYQAAAEKPTTATSNNTLIRCTSILLKSFDGDRLRAAREFIVRTEDSFALLESVSGKPCGQKPLHTGLRRVNKC